MTRNNNLGVQERPALVRRNPTMQAPLRKGKKETLGRVKGVKRTGRSLLFGLLLIGLVTASSLFYTWERLLVETMLRQNHLLEKELELVENKTAKLSYDIARLEFSERIQKYAKSRLGMTELDWDDVVHMEVPDGQF